MDISEETWRSIKNRVILPLWNGKFKNLYESAKLDYDDFESLAGYELSRAINKFNPEKSNLLTFSTKIISNKAMTELRDCTQREKRKALYTAESIEKPIDNQKYNSAIGDNIPFEDKKDKDTGSELSELRVGNFINSLNNNQLRVLILSLLEFDGSDMPSMLNISNNTLQSIIRSLKDVDLTRVLYRRKF